MRKCCLLLSPCLWGFPTAAVAQEQAAEGPVFVEVGAGYGMQLGTAPYIPEGDGTRSHNPFTRGAAYSLGVGYALHSDVQAFVAVAVTNASSSNGGIEQLLQDIDGSLSYRTLALGLRLLRPFGPGRLYAGFGLGLVLPFKVWTEMYYAAEAQALDVWGYGLRVDEYNMGYGAQAALGYQVLLGERLYASGAFELKAFATNNDNRTTTFDNYLVDTSKFLVRTDRIRYSRLTGAGPTAPSTYSVQELRLHLKLGVRF